MASCRSRRRKAQRKALREAELDQGFVGDFANAIRQHFARCLSKEAFRLQNTGRSAALNRRHKRYQVVGRQTMFPRNVLRTDRD
jgi:hypothetical protein